jgi:hypothetical protein
MKKPIVSAEGTDVVLIPKSRNEVFGPAKVLCDLVRAAVASGFYDELQSIVAGHPHKAVVPETALWELRGAGSSDQRERSRTENALRSRHKSLPLGKVTATEIELSELLALIRSILKWGSSDVLDQIVAYYQNYAAINVPGSLANDIKQLLSRIVSHINAEDLRTATMVMKSICDGDDATTDSSDGAGTRGSSGLPSGGGSAGGDSAGGGGDPGRPTYGKGVCYSAEGVRAVGIYTREECKEHYGEDAIWRPLETDGDDR